MSVATYLATKFNEFGDKNLARKLERKKPVRIRYSDSTGKVEFKNKRLKVDELAKSHRQISA